MNNIDLKIKPERNDYGKGFIYYHPDENGKFRCWELLDEALYQALEDLVERASNGALANVVGQSEQLVCECGNKLTDKELYFGQCLQCDKNVEE